MKKIIFKKIMVVFVIFLFFILCIFSGNCEYRNIDNLYVHPTYYPEEINLKDASFHPSDGRFNGGWWYFEGIFDNGYSIICSIIHLSKGKFGIGVQRLYIFKNGIPVFQRGEYFSFKDFIASEDSPFVKIFEKPIINFDIEKFNNTGEWLYNISMEIDNCSVDLQYIGTTKGWKGELLRGWYGPVLPKANVVGSLTVEGITINVTGIGYHEHGWNIPFPVYEYGWYWGKVVSKNFSLYWAIMLQNRWREQQRVSIFSEDKEDFINIVPENFKFKATQFRFYKNRIIPTKFFLNVSEPDTSLYVNATAEIIDIYPVIFGPIHHYKYHIKVNGRIQYGSITEEIIEQIQIMECMRFR